MGPVGYLSVVVYIGAVTGSTTLTRAVAAMAVIVSGNEGSVTVECGVVNAETKCGSSPRLEDSDVR